MQSKTDCSLLNGSDTLSYRIIAIDIDGTLLNDEKRITLNNYTAIRRYIENGGIIILTSGRLPTSVKWHAKLLGLDNLHISLNGTIITIDTLIQKSAINVASAAEFIQFCKKKQIYCQLYTDSGIVVDTSCNWNMHWSEKNVAWLENNISMPVNVAMASDYCPVLRVDDLHAFLSQNPVVHKIVVLSDTPLNYAKEHLSTIPDLVVTSSDAANLEIMPQGSGKGQALAWLANKLNVDYKHIMAIGDNYNDVSMFHHAGLSIAMGNAPPKVKAAAHHVTLTNNESGVAYAINTWAYRS